MTRAESPFDHAQTRRNGRLSATGTRSLGAGPSGGDTHVMGQAALGGWSAAGHEVEDAAQGRDGRINRALNTGPRIFKADEIIHVPFHVLHLIEADRDRIRDDGGSRDPGVCNGSLAMFGLSLDESDCAVSGLVDGEVCHVSLLANVDSQKGSSAGWRIVCLVHGGLRTIVHGLEGILMDVRNSGVQIVEGRQNRVRIILQYGMQNRDVIGPVEEYLRLERFEKCEVAGSPGRMKVMSDKRNFLSPLQFLWLLSGHGFGGLLCNT